jgi:hypothetical protein
MDLLASREFVGNAAGIETAWYPRQDRRLVSDSIDNQGRVNLMASPVGERRVGSLRRMLLKVLTKNRGSVEVEKAYLEPYRKWLESLVQDRSEPIATTAAK